jgi:general L-amino acid transport system substrate-binding protein
MILGSPEKAKIIPLGWAQRFPALQAGEIDASVKLAEWTMSRDTDLKLEFSRPYFLGGTQFIVHKKANITKAAELAGATVCGEAGTSTIRHASDYLTGLGVKYELIQFEKQEEAQAAYTNGRCDAFIGWGPNLAVFKSDASDGADNNVILPDLIAMGPQSVAVREGDDQFLDVVNWLISILIDAEANGVTQANVDAMKANPPNPTVARILGVDPGLGDRLGLPNDWGYKVIKFHGNYGEIFDRNLGTKSPYKLERGVNNLWNRGGVMYALTLD